MTLRPSLLATALVFALAAPAQAAVGVLSLRSEVREGPGQDYGVVGYVDAGRFEYGECRYNTAGETWCYVPREVDPGWIHVILREKRGGRNEAGGVASAGGTDGAGGDVGTEVAGGTASHQSGSRSDGSTSRGEGGSPYGENVPTRSETPPPSASETPPPTESELALAPKK